MGMGDKKRVAILVDTETHMMPALAREMARRNHNLVIANSIDGLADELNSIGAEVESISEHLDLAKADAVKKLVDAANNRFGGFDSACIRTGAHNPGEILDASEADCDEMYEGNFKQAFFALQALLPQLIEKGSGQIVINTSSTSIRPTLVAPLYSAQRAAANMLVRCAALAYSPKGIAINATGTYAMDYPGYLNDVGANTPEGRKREESKIPLRRLCKPEEAAHFVATLIDGVGTFQTGQFFSIDGGWAFQ